jgi:hypothetical protein
MEELRQADDEQPPKKEKLTFRQFRKLGWNIIKRVKGSNKFNSNLWAGQRITGVDFDYDDCQPEDYDDLIPIVAQGRDMLLADGVFEIVPKPK